MSFSIKSIFRKYSELLSKPIKISFSAVQHYIIKAMVFSIVVNEVLYLITGIIMSWGPNDPLDEPVTMIAALSLLSMLAFIPIWIVLYALGLYLSRKPISPLEFKRYLSMTGVLLIIAGAILLSFMIKFETDNPFLLFLVVVDCILVFDFSIWYIDLDKKWFGAFRRDH